MPLKIWCQAAVQRAQIIPTGDDRVDQKRPGHQRAGRIPGNPEGLKRAVGQRLRASPVVPEHEHGTPVNEPRAPIPQRRGHELERRVERRDAPLPGENGGVRFGQVAQRHPAPARSQQLHGGRELIALRQQACGADRECTLRCLVPFQRAPLEQEHAQEIVQAKAPRRQTVSFQWPLALLALLAVPLAIGGYILLERRRHRQAAAFATPALVPNLVGRSPARLRHRAPALALFALAALAIGLARPHAMISVKQEQATVVLAMDTSKSMAATDVPPSRLAVAQQAVRRFLDKLPEDYRVGMVSFA